MDGGKIYHHVVTPTLYTSAPHGARKIRRSAVGQLTFQEEVQQRLWNTMQFTTIALLEPAYLRN